MTSLSDRAKEYNSVNLNTVVIIVITLRHCRVSALGHILNLVSSPEEKKEEEKKGEKGKIINTNH